MNCFTSQNLVFLFLVLFLMTLPNLVTDKWSKQTSDLNQRSVSFVTFEAQIELVVGNGFVYFYFYLNIIR
jgi:preprotein translocase subunit Sec63